MSDTISVPSLLLEFRKLGGDYYCTFRPKNGLNSVEIGTLAAPAEPDPDYYAAWRKLMVDLWSRGMRKVFGGRFVSVEEQLGSGVGDYYRFGLILHPRKDNGEG